MQRGKRELQEGLSWGNGAPNKQNKRRRKTGKEKGGGSTNDAGVTYKVAVPKLSTVPVQRSSEHRKGMLPAQGWGMAGLEGQGSKSQGSFAAPELSFPITNKTSLWTQCHGLVHLGLHHDLLSLSWHGNLTPLSVLGSARTPSPLPLMVSAVFATPHKMLILRKILDTEEG